MRNAHNGTPTEPKSETLVERMEIPNSPIVIVKLEKEYFPTLGMHRLSEDTFSSYESAVEYCKTENMNFMIQLIAAISHYSYTTLNNKQNEITQ